jgi:hypothetical protein
MKNQELTQLENQLKQAFVRLSAQEGKSLALPVSQRVTTTNHKRSPISRFDVDHTDKVDIDDLEVVQAHKSDNSESTTGLCIRLIFDGRLYAVHGEAAETLKLWAEKSSRLKARQRIDKMPAVVFQNVEGKVKLFKGELLAA